MIDISYDQLVWVLAALTYTAVGLISFCAALGRGYWFWRVAVVIAMLGLFFPIEAYDLLLIYSAQAAVVIVPLTLLRYLRGWRDRARDVSDDAEPQRDARPRFTLRDVFLLTFAAAVIFAGSYYIPLDEWEDAWYPVACGASIGVVTLAAAWLGLGGRRWMWLRALVALVILPPVVALFPFDELTLLDTLIYLDPDDGSTTIAAGFLALAGAMLIAISLLFVRAAHLMTSVRCAEQPMERPPGSFGDSQFKVLFAARVAAAFFLMVIFLPPVTIYYFLLNPTPIPDDMLPEPNGFDELVKLVDRVPDASNPGQYWPATEAEMRRFVTEHRDVLDAVGPALERECHVPLQFTPEDLELDRDLRRLTSLVFALRMEGDLAAMEGRVQDAFQSHLEAVRLFGTAARGGLGYNIDFATGQELIGNEGIYKIRKDMSPAQQGNRT